VRSLSADRFVNGCFPGKLDVRGDRLELAVQRPSSPNAISFDRLWSPIDPQQTPTHIETGHLNAPKRPLGPFRESNNQLLP